MSIMSARFVSALSSFSTCKFSNNPKKTVGFISEYTLYMRSKFFNIRILLCCELTKCLVHFSSYNFQYFYFFVSTDQSDIPVVLLDGWFIIIIINNFKIIVMILSHITLFVCYKTINMTLVIFWPLLFINITCVKCQFNCKKNYRWLITHIIWIKPIVCGNIKEIWCKNWW